MWRVVVCDQETSQAWRLKPTRGLERQEKNKIITKVNECNRTLSVLYRAL